MPSSSLAITEIGRFPKRERRHSAVNRVYEDIRERIIDLSLPPGAAISKNDVAAAFGVSQTPVREALLRLENEGLVEIFPQSKTVVSLIDVQNAREAHFLRLSVEVEIARRLGPIITATQAEGLRSLIDRQALELKAGDLSAFTACDNRFHERIYELAGVGGLWDLIRTKRAQFDRLRRLHLPTAGKAEGILEEHRAIVDALAKNDADAAERAVRDHLRGTVWASEQIRAHFPDYFL